jgi:hypothetical protein
MVRTKKVVIAALGIVLILVTLAAAKDIEPLDARLVEVYRTVMGKSEPDIMQQASLQAIRMCIARIYLGDQLIMARRLLDKYVESNPERFIYSREVIEKEYVGDQIRMKLRLYVDNQKLIKDLREKRFIFEPQYRPFFTAFLEETLDGAKASYTTGNKTIAETILDRGGKFSDERMTSPAADQDVSRAPALLHAARVEAERGGIEIFITGTEATSLIEKRELYYDVYYFYQTDVTLKLVRGDTGEILTEVHMSGAAANIDPDRAIEISIRKAVGDAASEIYDYYKKVWNKLILNEVNYQILLTDVSKEDLGLFSELLRSLGKDAEVYIKNYDNNIAVVNLVYGGKRGELLRTMLSASHPRLKVIAQSGKMFELQVEN